MTKRAALYWHSLRHTRASQLVARALLTTKRKALVQAARWRLPGLPARPSADARCSHNELHRSPVRRDVLLPLFSPRCHLFDAASGQPTLCLLNQRFPLEVPYNWHDARLEKGTRLEKLNLHYMEYLEAVDDRLFAEIVEDWIAQNAPYREGYWRDCWNSYALSIRCVVWMQQFAVRRQRLTERARALLLASLLEQMRFLRRNLEFDIRGNHLMKNIKALLWAGRFFEGSEADSWTRCAKRLLRRELAEQVLPDGMHYERSPAYHAAVFADLLECFQVLEPGDTRRALETTLAAMADALVRLTHPDGMISLFGDGGLHMGYAPGECLDVYRRLTQASPRSESSISLAQAGYFGIRQEGTYFLANFGQMGPDFLPAHAHGDVFSFEWDLCGRRIIVDAGVYEYHPGAWRAYSRSTQAHNTVTLAAEDQSQFWSAFRVGQRAKVRLLARDFASGSLTLDGEHDGYARLPGKPIHRRRIAAAVGRLEVKDWVTGGRGQPVAARLLCHPDCRVSVADGKVGISLGNVAVELATAARIRVDKAWWSPDFGQCVETSQIVMDYGTAPCEGEFTLVSLATRTTD